MLRYLLFLVLFVVFIVAIVFASSNAGPLELDLAFTQVQTTVAMAMLGFFVAGWAFGLFCAMFVLLRMYNERRQLRKALKLAESEVTSLRRMPMHDAR